MTYNVFSIVIDSKMVNFGKSTKMNGWPMTLRQANTFISKHTAYTWRKMVITENC